MAVKKIFTIVTEDYINKLIEAIELTPGPDGKSAYNIAVEQGFDGSEKEWLDSLVGPKGDQGEAFKYDDFTEEQLEALRGPQGLSAYQTAVEEGFEGSEEEWINSLKGEQGKAFEYEDFTKDQLEALRGPQGFSAYQAWKTLEGNENGSVEEFINSLKGDQGIDGLSAYEIAVENGFEGSEEEWLNSLVGRQGVDGKPFEYEDFTEEQLEALRGPQGEQGIQGELGPQGIQGPAGKFDMESLYDILQTEDKTVIGAINELFTKINDWLHPNCDLKAQMFYGVIDPTTSGVITSYSDITVDMLSNSNSIKSTIPGERIALSMGYVKEGSYIVIAVPTMYDFNITKDNGFGGKVAFDDDIVGANGIDVKFDEIDYRIYGELAIVSGERFVYIETPKQESGGNCGCYNITIEDIDDVMSDLFK